MSEPSILGQIEQLLGQAVDLHQRGQVEPSERILRRALDLARNRLGTHPEELAGVLNDLGRAHFRKGNNAEAEAIFREALELAHASCGENDHRVFLALNKPSG